MAFLYLALMLLAGSPLTTESLHQPLKVYVDGTRGNDSQKCLNSSSVDTPCQSLSFVTENLVEKDSVYIEILGDLLNLTGAVDFINYSNLIICGSSNKTVIYCNETDAGLAFVRVINVSICSLTVGNCGALRPSTSADHEAMEQNLNLSVALYIINCTDVAIWNVNIVSSNGTGLSLYDTNGTVAIETCVFTENGAVEQRDSGGGGLHIEFTFCSPGYGKYCSSHNGRNANSTYLIRDCTFALNAANSSLANHAFIPPSVNKIPRRGQGGGLYMSIDSDAANNHFTIENCMFEENSASYFAGGMYAEFLNSVRDNLVIINQTRFIRNKCSQTDFSGGGALFISTLLYTASRIQGKSPENNRVICESCLFEKNKANMGGGTAVCAAKEADQSSLSTISFSNCNWTENESAMGAGLLITPGLWNYTKEGYLPVIRFTNCRFESNSAIQELYPPMAEGDGVKVESVGYGAVFVSELRVMFEGRSYFSDSMGSAVHLSNSVMEFMADSDVTFHNNTSHNGGAIAMYGSSMIQIEGNSSMLWTNNTAYSLGGAIYFNFNAATHPAYHNCFISSRDYSRVNSTLIFRNNSARANGNSIFTTTFQSCALLCANDAIPDTPEDIMQCIANFMFDDSETGNSSLATRPERFELSANVPLELIPGKEFVLPLSVRDEANTSLSDVVYEAHAWPNISMDPAFFQVSNNTIKVRGMNGSIAELQLFTSDLIVSFNITLTECQPGYTYSSSSSMCECASSKYLGLEDCYPAVYLRHSYWIGYCSGNSGELCTVSCPYGFCSYSQMDPRAKSHALPNNSHSLNSAICGPSRRNRLCGECSPGFSMYHNSEMYRCGQEHLCYLGWFFYIMSDIVPLTLLFIVVLVLNISFTTGNANCFVLYGQVLGFLSFNGNVRFPYAVRVLQVVVMFFYKSFNLHFFALESLSFCLWKGASIMGAMMMNYLTVCFALALVLVTIFITRYRFIRSKIFFHFRYRNSVLIHGLSAFFILCYSQAARTTFHILNYSCLYSENFKCKVKVVNHAGHLSYLRGEHVPYAIVAFIFLIVMIIIPPLLLLLYPLIFKLLGICNLSETKPVRILWKLMPIQFLDAFQSSFKDKYRFFAGFYFLYRAAILALYVCAQSWMEYYAVVQLLLTAILTLHSVLQPHKEKRHNIIDSLLFANLCLINAITLYYYGKAEFLGQFQSEVFISALAVIQAVLIILPLFVAIILHLVRWKRSMKENRDSSDLPPLRHGEEDPLIQKT